jgi:hypothetical protein
MTVFPKIFWSSHEIIVVCKQESAREGELSEDIWHPDNNSDRSLKAESTQMRYLYEGMTWDAGAFYSERKKNGGVRGQ